MNDSSDPFLDRYRGYFRNLLKWEDLDAFWQVLRGNESKSWYIYAVGETPPEQTVSREQLLHFIEQIDELLHKEHQEDYCGIVYVDDIENPSFIKIYDPHNLGSVCGPGFGPPPFPGWILSLLPPADLNAAFPPPGNRRRWWQRIFG